MNYDDYDFCKVILDDKSCRFFIDNFRVINSSLNQRVFSRALFEMVKDAKISSMKYLEFTVNSIGLDLSQDII